MQIVQYLPYNLANVVRSFDGIIQTHLDTIAVATLSGLASLAHGTTVSLSVGGKGRPIIIYGAAFMQSGTGKSAAANVVRKYLLQWREEQYLADKNQKHTEDFFLESASAEGLEVSLAGGSSPFFFLDELGILIKMSKTDMVKQALIRALMGVFDAGTVVTRRLKADQRAALIQAKGLGLFASSTLGAANLSHQDIKDLISNGALNRFLVTFGGIKAIPFKDELEEVEAESMKVFAQNFYRSAHNKHFSFNNKALEFYQDFHVKVNEAYLNKLYMQDDGAGLTVRQLTFLQRISALFQICIDVQNNQKDNKLIGLDAVEKAYQFLNYLDINHFEQIGLYAKAKDGKISAETHVLNKILKEPGIDQRKLCTDLSYRLKANQVKSALGNLKMARKVTEKESKFYMA